MKLAYYVSSHGFGHISRSFEVIKQLLSYPEVTELHLITTRLEFIKEYKHPKLITKSVATDVGVYQQSSISLDVQKTLNALESFWKEQSRVIEQEMDYLKKNKIDRILSDSSSLPFLLSKKLNLPSYFVGNFTWDFIYSHYAKYNSKFKSIAERIREEYSHCNKGWIIPFYCDMSSIPDKIYIGLVGRKSAETKDNLRSRFGFLKDKIYLLLSFGAYGLKEEDFYLDNLDEKYQLVVSGYEGFRSNKFLRLDSGYYPEVVKACDYVLTKPGYGILSECYLAKTKMIYTDRGDFPEYPYLVNSLNQYFDSYYITQEQLYELKFMQEIENKIPKASYNDIQEQTDFLTLL